MTNDMQVLLVEDNPMDRELTIRSLQGHGFGRDILVATDGVEAIEMIRHQTLAGLKFALVDLKLPKIDGFEVIKAIRASQQIRLLPIVVFSSSEEEGDIRKSYEVGANSYVVKPILYDDIDRVISEISSYWREVNKKAQTVAGYGFLEQSVGEKANDSESV